jgi:hypothetical protein
MESGSESSFSSEKPRVRIQGFDDQKLEKIQLKKMNMFLIKNWYLLIPCLLKGRSSYRRCLQPSKENIQHFKK